MWDRHPVALLFNSGHSSRLFFPMIVLSLLPKLGIKQVRMGREFQKRSISVAGIVIGILLFSLFLMVPSGFLHLTPVSQKAIGVGLLMIILWVPEAIPIPVTSLLPIVLFPLLGVLPLQDALEPYASPVIMLFFGGFVIALALEKYNIHRRVALNLVHWTGTSPSRVIAGFMIATAFLSMWISNTSTAVIMFPIGMSIISIVEKQYGKDSQLLRRFGLALMLGIAYAANIGGSGTLVGTPSNAILVGMLSPDLQYTVGFCTLAHHWNALDPNHDMDCLDHSDKDILSSRQQTTFDRG